MVEGGGGERINKIHFRNIWVDCLPFLVEFDVAEFRKSTSYLLMLLNGAVVLSDALVLSRGLA